MFFAAGLFRGSKISNKPRGKAFSWRERRMAMYNELESDHFNNPFKPGKSWFDSRWYHKTNPIPLMIQKVMGGIFFN
jgi:hypothetical protein